MYYDWTDAQCVFTQGGKIFPWDKICNCQVNNTSFPFHRKIITIISYYSDLVTFIRVSGFNNSIGHLKIIPLFHL